MHKFIGITTFAPSLCGNSSSFNVVDLENDNKILEESGQTDSQKGSDSFSKSFKASDVDETEQTVFLESDEITGVVSQDKEENSSQNIVVDLHDDDYDNIEPMQVVDYSHSQSWALMKKHNEMAQRVFAENKK